MFSAGDNDTSDPHSPGRLRFELLLGISLVLFGFLVLPALIYMVGTALLGEYAGGGHLGSFYGDILRDLGQGSLQAWGLILGPFLLVEVGRLIFFRHGNTADDRPAATKAPPTPRAKPTVRERREPTLKL